MSTLTDARRCPARGTKEWVRCEKPIDHDGPHYAWLGGYGGVQWREKERLG